MNRRHTLLYAAGCALLAASAMGQQDRAVPRSGGGGSAGAGAGAHPTPSVHSSSGGGQSSSPTTSSATPSHGMTTAERRHPRAGTGRGSGGGYYPSHPIYPGYPGWGWGGYYPAYWGYWWPYGYGYSAWGAGYWTAPWGAGAVYSYAQPDRGAIRVLADPSDARVYVDGYYAGVVDDFDGLFQRLHLAPGRHEISLKLGGYKTHRVRVYVGSGSTLKIDHEMEEGAGETYQDLAPDAAGREARAAASYEPVRPGEPDPDAQGTGELRLLVDPRDASVYVDGEFRGTGREASTLTLAPGRHRVEVVRPGYRTAEHEVEVARDGSAEVSIELQRP
jgi:archaellum component FlaG (FlaF/FlaG flagellin family)